MAVSTSKGWPSLATHHAALETVLRNLISNAIKHHPDPASGSINVACSDEGSHVRISVTDDGEGIPAEYADKVFKMFQTLKPRDDTEGSGMGLAIVQRIIDWQGGSIWFEDGPNGKGVIFHFTWNKSPQDMPTIGDGNDEADAGAIDKESKPADTENHDDITGHQEGHGDVSDVTHRSSHNTQVLEKEEMT